MIPCNTKQERKHRPAGSVEAPATLNQREKNVLGYVFGRRDTTRHMKSETINRTLAPPIELGKRHLVTFEHLRQKSLVGFAHASFVGRLRAASVMNSAGGGNKFQKDSCPAASSRPGSFPDDRSRSCQPEPYGPGA